MPHVTYRAPLWTKEYFDKGVKYAMELDQQDKPLKEMRNGTIILEGDLRVKIIAYNATQCAIRYARNPDKTMTLERRFMNFRYVKEKARAV